MSRYLLFFSLLFVGMLLAVPVPKEKPVHPWPCLGGSPQRNMVQREASNLLDNFDPESGAGILWKALLGNCQQTQPVVGGGVILVGTNNAHPRNARDQTGSGQDAHPKDMTALMAFDVKTGQFRWQAVEAKNPNNNECMHPGHCSTPFIDGHRAYYISSNGVLRCVDLNGFSDGNQGFQDEEFQDESDADIIWQVDLAAKYDVVQHGPAYSSPLIVDDILYIVTGNGLDSLHQKVTNPDAPSFLALNKNTGKLIWKDNSPGKNILHAQWGSPAYAALPVPQILVPGGDGFLRAFEPLNGKLLWKFNCNPAKTEWNALGTGNRHHFVNAPVVHDGRVYIAVGDDPEFLNGEGHLWCIDLKKAVDCGKRNADNDVSPRENNWDPEAAVNKNSALAWHYGGPDEREFSRRHAIFDRSMSTVCVVDEVLYTADILGYLHCLNAKTGEPFWTYDLSGQIRGSPLFADGKLFLGSSSGQFFIFKHTAKPPKLDPTTEAAKEADAASAKKRYHEVKKKLEKEVLIRKIEVEGAISSAPTAVGNVLYLATDTYLYAIGKKQ